MKEIKKGELIKGKTYWTKVKAYSRQHPFVEHTEHHRLPVYYEGPIRFIGYEDRGDPWEVDNAFVYFPVKVEHLSYNETIKSGGGWAKSAFHKAYLLAKDYKMFEVGE